MSDHQSTDATERLRALFEESLDQIERAVSWVSRRLSLVGDDADEFRSWVHEKLIEDDYHVLREFSARSKLATYLVAVIQNLARDYRLKEWGRWRPSAAAERLGLVAVQLETLLHRDGFSMDEAAESLRFNYAVKMGRLEIMDLAAKLPPRTRLSFEGDAGVALAVADTRTDERVMEAEREEMLDRTQEALTQSLGELNVEDRLVLKMHYQSGLTIAAIATALDLEQRTLYTRRDRCLRRLEASLEASGLHATDVFEALGWSGAEFKVNYDLQAVELDENEPSNSVKAGAEDST